MVLYGFALSPFFFVQNTSVGCWPFGWHFLFLFNAMANGVISSEFEERKLNDSFVAWFTHYKWQHISLCACVCAGDSCYQCAVMVVCARCETRLSCNNGPSLIRPIPSMRSLRNEGKNRSAMLRSSIICCLGIEGNVIYPDLYIVRVLGKTVCM